MSPIETLRGFVDAWECDENDHLNVQFYFGLFEDATAHFFALAGVAPGERPAVEACHVRFHSELRGGQLVRIDSHAASTGGPGRWQLVHRMSEPATGRLAATAVDTYSGDAPLPAVMEVFAEARPRSLAPEPADIGWFALQEALVSHRGRLGLEEIDARGRAFHRAIVARFSDSAPHFWEALGAPQPWLADSRLGRVALEMKLTPLAPVSPGLIELRSGPLALGNKTVSFFHVVKATDGGEIIAVGEVTALLFDRERRRAIELPAEVRAKVAAALDQTGPS